MNILTKYMGHKDLRYFLIDLKLLQVPLMNSNNPAIVCDFIARNSFNPSRCGIVFGVQDYDRIILSTFSAVQIYRISYIHLYRTMLAKLYTYWCSCKEIKVSV